MSSLQVQRIGFRIGLSGFEFLAQQRDLQRVHHGCRDLVLDGKHVLQFPIVSLRPEMPVRPGIDELGADADLTARLAHTALKDMCDAKLLGHGRNIHTLAFEAESG